MQQFEWVHGAWLGMAIVLEIVANVFLKFSDGFRRKTYGVLSLAAVLAAFSALSQAVKGIDLSVAYALWGGFGIAATLAAGWVLFGQRLNNKGWIGVILLPVTTGSIGYSFANSSSLSRKPVTDMARLSARQRSFAAGAELCTPINCQPVSVFNINGEPLSPGSVSH